MTRFLFIREMLEMIILTASILAIIYLAGWLVLVQAINDLAASTLLVNKEFPKYNQDIKLINKAVRDFNSSAAGFTRILPDIQDIAKNLPGNIRLTALSVNRADNTVSLSGVAADRDALLNYVKIVNSIPWLEGAANPTSLLFTKENVPFDLKVKIKSARK